MRRDLRTLDAALTGIVGALLQDSSRAAGTIVGVAASKLVAAGVMAGTFGAIGLFGAASTGTAIATLSGAAATTATLYWVGSTVGLGVAGGSMILTGGGLALGIPAAILVRRRLFGRRRTPERLRDCEQAVLYAALRLAAPVRVARAQDMALAPLERRLYAREGLAPLLSALSELFADKEKEAACVDPSGSLAFLPRQRLRRSTARLAKVATRWSRA
ncbi:hypothetical protein [Limimaricola soesokkakensis]|uniref:hypothetical protein n=1 Tax=Limimaricola soesokkakensis TaxID=1343159 RepID=UPI0035111B23